MLDVIKGEGGASCIPWVPRFDLYFNAHHLAGTLPEKYQHCESALEMSMEMGVGYHAVTPDYLRPSDPDGIVDRALGIYRLHEFPYRVYLRGVERKVECEGDRTCVTYRTPKGTVQTQVFFTGEMRSAGASISWIEQHAIKDEDDFDVVGYIFENAEVEPDYEGYLRLKSRVGDAGVVVANACSAASPMQFILRDLMDPTRFFYALYDYPRKLERLAEQIAAFFRRFMPIAAQAPAEVIQFGANFDATITYPPFFSEHILPWIEEFSSMAHEHGKYVLCHTDGENDGLWDLYRQSGMDIAEAVALKPMTKNTIGEVLEAASGRMTIFGGVSSILLQPLSCSEREFEAAVREVIGSVGPRDRLILGISDTTPVDADFRRIERVQDIMEEFREEPCASLLNRIIHK